MQNAAAVTQQQSTSSVPAIGAEWQGGIYAGLTIHDNKPAHLVLLPETVVKPWKAAMAWAAKQDAELPSRIDALVLLKNLKSEFEERWYWTGEQCASDPGSAWLQVFGDGGQGSSSTDGKFRARAVRRLPI